MCALSLREFGRGVNGCGAKLACDFSLVAAVVTLAKMMIKRRHMQRSMILLTILVSGLVLGCAAVEGTTRVQKIDKKQLEADSKVYFEHVRVLSSPDMEGRGAGYEGLDKAREYVKAHFAHAGLRPAVRGEGTQELGYYQNFEVNLPAREADKGLVILTSHSTERAWDKRELINKNDYNVMGFSASKPFKGHVVFAGYGIVAPEYHYDSYRGIDPEALKGAVVFVYRFEPCEEKKSKWAKDQLIPTQWTRHASLAEKAKWAAERGACAMVVVNPPDFELTSLQTTAVTYYKKGQASIPVLHAKPEVFAAVLESAGYSPNRRMREFQVKANRGTLRPMRIRNVSVEGAAEIYKPEASMDNVLAMVQGNGPLSQEVVFVGAHYDHLGHGEIGSRTGTDEIHYGADDNASGVALLIMLAERYKAFVEEHPDQNRRTVVFAAFSGEERGLLGSRHMMKNQEDLALPEDYLIAAMVNYDMVGRMEKNRLFIFRTDTSMSWRKMIRKANEGVDFRLIYPSRVLGDSDHDQFIDKRIPAIHFFTGVHEDYHTPSDTFEKINADDSVRLLVLSDKLLQDVVMQPKRLRFYDKNHGPTTRKDMSESATLGLRGQFLTKRQAKMPGMKITHILPDMAAMKADLEIGDVIVAWDGKKIGTEKTFRHYLYQSEPGDEVKLTVLRDGEEIKVLVIMEARSKLPM